MTGAVIYVLTLMAFVAAGDSAAAVPLRSPLAVQQAQDANFGMSNRTGKNYRTGRNGIVTPPATIAPKKAKPKKAARGAKAPKTSGKTKVQQPKVSAPPQAVYNSDLVDRTLGPMR